MVDIPTTTNVIVAVSVAFGMAMGVIQLRNLVKTRQAQLFMDLYEAY